MAIKMETYQQIINSLTFPCFVLEPLGGQFLIRETNNEYVNARCKTIEQLIGMGIPDVFPENPEHLGTCWGEIHNSLNSAFVNGKPDKIEELSYDILIHETDEFEEAYWYIENIPIKTKPLERLL